MAFILKKLPSLSLVAHLFSALLRHSKNNKH